MDILKNFLKTKTGEKIKNKLADECFNIRQGKLIRSYIGLQLINLLNVKYNEDYENLLIAVELIHNASLMHDDVIDNETLRRGETSYNITLGNKNSILYGNLILIKSMQYIENLNSKEIRKNFIETLNKMCTGEIYQKDSINKVPTIDEYIIKSALKTGSLFLFIGKSILTLSGNNKNGILDFCNNYGIAFQINNDIENYKNSDSDKQNGIFTAPYIYEEMTHNKAESIEKALSLKDNYIRKAKESIEFIVDNKYKQGLIEVLECLKN